MAALWRADYQTMSNTRKIKETKEENLSSSRKLRSSEDKDRPSALKTEKKSFTIILIIFATVVSFNHKKKSCCKRTISFVATSINYCASDSSSPGCSRQEWSSMLPYSSAVSRKTKTGLWYGAVPALGLCL